MINQILVKFQSAHIHTVSNVTVKLLIYVLLAFLILSLGGDFNFVLGILINTSALPICMFAGAVGLLAFCEFTLCRLDDSHRKKLRAVMLVVIFFSRKAMSPLIVACGLTILAIVRAPEAVAFSSILVVGFMISLTIGGLGVINFYAKGMNYQVGRLTSKNDIFYSSKKLITFESRL